MHDTARCLGYPSDSSWTARKRLGSQLSGASPLSFPRTLLLCSFADAHRRHLRHWFGRLVRPAVQHSSLPPGGLPRRPLGSRGRCPGPITLLRLLGRSAVCTGSPVAGDCGGFGITGPYAVRIPSSESRGPSGRRAFKLGGHRARLQSVGPRAGQPHAGPRGRAPALLTVAGVVSPRAQARLQLLDSDGVGPDGAGRPDSDGDSEAGPDHGPARTRCHVSPRSRTRLAVNAPLVPAPRASRLPASLH